MSTDWESGFPEGNNKLCPNCAQYVADSVAICPNCSYDFNTGMVGQSGSAVTGGMVTGGTPVIADYNVAEASRKQRKLLMSLLILPIMLGAGVWAYFQYRDEAGDLIQRGRGVIDDLQREDSNGSTGGGDSESSRTGSRGSCIAAIDGHFKRILAQQGQPPNLDELWLNAANDLGASSFEFNTMIDIYSQTPVLETAILKSTPKALRQARPLVRKACTRHYG